jgi:RHS repeat-associated protein
VRTDTPTIPRDESGQLDYGYRYYTSSSGRWISRDPIEEQGGFNFYGFVNNNSLSYFDLLGLKCCGNFIVRAKPDIKVPDSQLQSSGGKERLDGFEVQYIPCDPCSCPKDKIKLVQAIKSNGGTGVGPHMDADVGQRSANISGSDKSLPPYPGYPGNHGPQSYIDAPNNPRKMWGETTFTMEVCAVCKQGDKVLGCMAFSFGDVERKPKVPGGTARPKGDGLEKGCSEPGRLWNDALKDWNTMK